VEIATPNYFHYAKYRAARRAIAERYGRSGITAGRGDQRKSGEALFPGENPLGHHIKTGKAEAERRVDHRRRCGERPCATAGSSRRMYHDLPFVPQAPPYYTTVVLRTAGDPLKFVFRGPRRNCGGRWKFAAVQHQADGQSDHGIDCWHRVRGTMMAALGAIATGAGISRRFRGHVLLGERENPGDRNPHVDGCADKQRPRVWCFEPGCS